MGLPYLLTLGWCQGGQWGGMYGSFMGRRVWELHSKMPRSVDVGSRV